MPKATWNGVVVAEASDDTVKVVEGNVYFPPESVSQEHLSPSETTSRCHWKGTANYFNVSAGGEINPDAAWVYNNPLPAAKEIAGYIAFWHGVQVAK